MENRFEGLRWANTVTLDSFTTKEHLERLLALFEAPMLAPPPPLFDMTVEQARRFGLTPDNAVLRFDTAGAAALAEFERPRPQLVHSDEPDTDSAPTLVSPWVVDWMAREWSMGAR